MRRVFLSFLALAAVSACHKQASAPPQAATPSTATASPPASGTQVLTSNAGKRGPESGFEAADGKATRLADFKGKAVLVNLWATWCVPCVREMPALDQLAARTGGKLTVLTINEGLEKRQKIDDFWKARGFKALKLYVDKNNGLMLALKEQGLPVSVLYDKDGKEIARVEGPIDWTGAQARGLLAKAGV